MPETELDALHARAEDDLRFIRSTMERAGSFTGIPGVGWILMGASALGAAYLASRQSTPSAWLAVWLGEAVLAFAIGVTALVRKARAVGVPLLKGAGWRFLSTLAPPMLAAAILTPALYLSERTELLPGVWLMLFGGGVMTGGAFSVRIVPIAGAVFMALGAAALFVPAERVAGDVFMALGFGLVHIVFGFIIAREYGG